MRATRAHAGELSSRIVSAPATGLVPSTMGAGGKPVAGLAGKIRLCYRGPRGGYMPKALKEGAIGGSGCLRAV